MASINPQGKNSVRNGNVLAIIPILALAIMLILAITLKESLAVLGVIINGFAVFINFLGYNKGLRKTYRRFFKNLPSLSFKRLIVSFSFILNIILICVILWPNFSNEFPGGIGSHTKQHLSPTPSINLTTTTIAQATIEVQQTTTARQNIYSQATASIPSISDTLSAQDGLKWDTFTTSSGSGSCLFKNGAYDAYALTQNSTSCEAIVTHYQDLAIEVEVTVIRDNGGLIFRSNNDESSFYAFSITTDGLYLLEKSIPSNSGQSYSPLASGKSSYIVQGTHHSNLLTVIARGNEIYLYINKHYVDSVIDDSFASGAVGVFTNSNGTDPSEAEFENLKVWKL